MRQRRRPRGRSTISSIGLDGVSSSTSCGRPRQRLAPLAEIGAVDELGLDAVARQQGGDDPVAGAEQRARRDHPVAGLQMRQQRGMHGGHAGGGGAAGLGALEQARRCSSMATVGLPKREYW